MLPSQSSAGLPHNLAAQRSQTLHESWLLPEQVFQETKAEATRFFMTQPQKSCGATSTDFSWFRRSAQIQYGQGAPKGVSAKRGSSLGGHAFPSLPFSAPTGNRTTPTSVFLPGLYPCFFSCLPCSTVGAIAWLVIFESSVPGLAPGPR